MAKRTRVQMRTGLGKGRVPHTPKLRAAQARKDAMLAERRALIEHAAQRMAKKRAARLAADDRINAGRTPAFARGGMVREHMSVPETISVARLPRFAEGGLAAGRDRSDRQRGDISINVTVPAGAMDERAARRTGLQIGAEIREQIAGATRRGY